MPVLPNAGVLSGLPPWMKVGVQACSPPDVASDREGLAGPLGMPEYPKVRITECTPSFSSFSSTSKAGLHAGPNAGMPAYQPSGVVSNHASLLMAPR